MSVFEFSFFTDRFWKTSQLSLRVNSQNVLKALKHLSNLISKSATRSSTLRFFLIVHDKVNLGNLVFCLELAHVLLALLKRTVRLQKWNVPTRQSMWQVWLSFFFF